MNMIITLKSLPNRCVQSALFERQTEKRYKAIIY